MNRRASAWMWLVMGAGLALWAAAPPRSAAPFGFEPAGGPPPARGEPAWAEAAGGGPAPAGAGVGARAPEVPPAAGAAGGARPALRVWVAAPAPPAAPWVAALAAWQRRHPEWAVEVVLWAGDGAARRLPAAVDAGRAPDVYLGPLPPGPAAAYAASFDPFLTAAERRAVAMTWPAAASSGHVWALPACGAFAVGRAADAAQRGAAADSTRSCLWLVVPRPPAGAAVTVDALDRLRLAAQLALELSRQTAASPAGH
ncbi:MAG: hypothetical protein IMW98_10265 [Firmicutes bacterium]|nr:hypothetical protein [Bacillota bacterium]